MLPPQSWGQELKLGRPIPCPRVKTCPTKSLHHAEFSEQYLECKSYVEKQVKLTQTGWFWSRGQNQAASKPLHLWGQESTACGDPRLVFPHGRGLKVQEPGMRKTCSRCLNKAEGFKSLIEQKV